jgi:hypothetical protein
MRLVILFVVLSACGREQARTPAKDPAEPKGPKYEARAWLAANRNPSALASNRFGETEVAAAFVDSLYQMGAESVYVVNVEDDSSWIRTEGGPYADALWIRLPGDPQMRARIFAIDEREARHEGFDPDRDQGQQYLFFWWD